MSKFIKYKRFVEFFKISDETKLQSFLDELITNGWEIIYYNENIFDDKTIKIIVLCGRVRQIL